MSNLTRTQEYALQADRTATGAVTLLHQTINEALDANALAGILIGEHPAAKADAEALALIRLRLREAQIYAERL